MLLKRRPLLAAALALLFAVAVFTLHERTLTHLADTDRFYHFAVSRMLVEHGAFHLETLPQAEDVGWDRYFPDKEFLFHVFTSIGYRMGGDRGVELMVLAIAWTAALTLFGFALTALSPLEAFALAFATFFSSFFSARMLLVRPHVLAISLFVFLCAMIAKRRPVLAGIAAAGYALSYHAFYLPLFASAVVALLSQLEKGKARKQLLLVAGSVAGGLFIGLVINPYFPSNVQIGVMQALVPFRLSGELKGAAFGLELYPLIGPGLLKFFYFPGLVVLAAIALRTARDFSSRFLLAMALAMGFLSFYTVRAGEYFIPLSGLLLVPLAAQFKDRRWLFAAAGVQFLALLYVARTEQNFEPEAEVSAATRSAIAAIPPGPAKVFNCDWASAPFLLHARPDLRFVDLLDPSFLFEASQALFQTKTDFLAGRITDPRAVVNKVFGADYVLCRSPGVVSQLQSDSAFQRIFPRQDQGSPISLFRVSHAPNPAYVHQVKFRFLKPEEAVHPRDYVPGAEKLESFQIPEFLVVLGLSDVRLPGTRCIHVSADPAEVKRLRGASWLGVGGGGALRAWRNGKLLFASGPEYTHARSVQALVRLEPVLRDSDSIDLLACSASASSFWTASLSLWSRAAAEAVCREKAASQGGSMTMATSAATTGAETCLGPLAEAAVPAELRP